MGSFPNRVRTLRRQKDWSGAEVADKLGISVQYYYNIERGRRKLSAEMAKNLAELHSVTIDFLLSDPSSDSMNSGPRMILEESTHPFEDKYIPKWATYKDKRDFKKMLEEDALVMFDGVPIDDEDREKVLRIMEAMFWDAKKRNKRKPIEE